jgi:hypothetical protein
MLDITYPEKLTNAAMCLRSIGDVHLPPGFSGKENEVNTLDVEKVSRIYSNDFQHVSDSRTFVAFSDYGSQPSTTPLALRAFGPPNHLRRLSPMPSKKPQPSSKSPAHKLTPRRKLRHEDSQIVFEPIASSSPLRAADETQNFTDHQKEVLDRQKDQAAAMFRDIGSDDVSSHSSRKLVINSDVVVVSSDAAEQDTSRPSTPDVGAQDAIDDDVPSSPITASQGRRQYRSSSSNPRSPAVPAVPSSPPSASKEAPRIVLLSGSENDAELDAPTELIKEDDVFMQDSEHESAAIIEESNIDSNCAVLPEMDDSIEPEEEELSDRKALSAFRLSSDDLPSSQLVAEMLASQSSPIVSRTEEVDNVRLGTSQITAPEEKPESQSTLSILREQRTLDDIFPEGVTQSQETEKDTPASQYGTRLRKSRASEASELSKSQSQEVEDVTLKRKRGRPRKQPLLKAHNTTEEGMKDHKTLRSSSKSSPNMNIHSTQASGSSSRSRRLSRKSSGVEPQDAEIESRLARRRSSSQMADNSTEAHADAPSSKRQKSINGSAVPVAVQVSEKEDTDKQDIEKMSLLSPKSIMARLQSLIADAKRVTWGRDEQMEIGDLSFQLQAATRGFVPVGRDAEDADTE